MCDRNTKKQGEFYVIKHIPMELSIVQMKDMLSIQQQELLRRQLLYMYEFLRKYMR